MTAFLAWLGGIVGPKAAKPFLWFVGVVALVILVLLLTQCGGGDKATEAKLATEQGEAAIDAGAVATNTIGGVIANDSATATTVEEGITDVRKAPEADRGLAAQRAACRLRAYRDSERCASLRKAGAPDAH